MTKLLFVIVLLSAFLTGSAQKYTVTIHQPDPLQVKSPTTEFRILAGSKIVLGKDLTITGGSGHYEMIWSGTGWKADSISKTITVVPQDTTIYTLAVCDQYGCSFRQLFHVNVIYPIQIECSTKPVSCSGKNDGAVLLKISGGAPPYKVFWSNGLSVDSLNHLQAGNYTVIAIDEMNQRQEKTITISKTAKIRNNLDVFICEGSSYKYNGDELKKEGWYKYTYISAKGCDSTVVINLSVNSLPKIPVITQNGDTLLSSAPIGNQWSKDGFEIEGADKHILVISHSGTYSVNVTNSSGCSSQSEAYSVVKTGVPIIQTADFHYKVFPNPNNGLFTIELESDKPNPVILELLTYEGRLITKKTVEHPAGKEQIKFGKAKLTNGVYTLRITIGRQTINRKILVT